MPTLDLMYVLSLTGRLGKAITDKKSEVSAEVRVVVFQSFKESVTSIRDRNLPDSGADADGDDRQCSMSLAELTDTLYGSWTRVSGGTRRRLAAVRLRLLLLPLLLPHALVVNRFLQSASRVMPVSP